MARLLPLLLSVVCLGMGCRQTGADFNTVEPMAVSPDGQWIAYVHSEGSISGYYIRDVMEMPAYTDFSDLSHFWLVPVADPEQARVEKIGDTETKYFFVRRGQREYVNLLVFSPDSTRIAWVSGGHDEEQSLYIVDVATGVRQLLHRGRGDIRGLAWLSPDEVVYTTLDFSDDDRWQVLRQRVDRADEPARVLAAGKRDKTQDSLAARAPKVSLSPDGRYAVVFGSPERQAFLLDVAGGEATSFGSWDPFDLTAAWKQDSSGVLCVLGYPVDKDYRFEVYLISPAEGRIEALPPEQVKEAGYTWSSLHDRWTADGRYVFPEHESKLISPVPWRIIDLRMPPDVPRVYRFGPLPLPGWCYVVSQTPDCYWPDKSYAVNYDQMRFVPLSESKDWAIGPHGDWIADIGQDGKATVRRLDLNAALAAPAAQEPASESGSRE